MDRQEAAVPQHCGAREAAAHTRRLATPLPSARIAANVAVYLRIPPHVHTVLQLHDTHTAGLPLTAVPPYSIKQTQKANNQTGIRHLPSCNSTATDSTERFGVAAERGAARSLY